METVSMRELEAQVKACQLCRLAKTRTNAVPGEGNSRAEVMFIGEGPGYHEDRQGRPFVGAAGKFLEELLAIAGLDRRSVYITNVVKCRPPNNRDPMPDEIAVCDPYLERQIALINPRVIVTLGRYSMARFFPGEKISQVHGTARVAGGRMCVAMYHPAAGLHQGSLADIIRVDFRKLPLYLEQAKRYTTHGAGTVEAAEAPEAPVEETRVEVIANGQGETVEALSLEEPAVMPPAEEGVVAEQPAAAEAEAAEQEVAAQPKPTAKRRTGTRKGPEEEQTSDKSDTGDRSDKSDKSDTGDGYKQMSFF